MLVLYRIWPSLEGRLHDLFLVRLEHLPHVADVDLDRQFRPPVLVHHEDVLGFGELHDEDVEVFLLNADLLDVGCVFATLGGKY